MQNGITNWHQQASYWHLCFQHEIHRVPFNDSSFIICLCMHTYDSFMYSPCFFSKNNKNMPNLLLPKYYIRLVTSSGWQFPPCYAVIVLAQHSYHNKLCAWTCVCKHWFSWTVLKHKHTYAWCIYIHIIISMCACVLCLFIILSFTLAKRMARLVVNPIAG